MHQVNSYRHFIGRISMIFVLMTCFLAPGTVKAYTDQDAIKAIIGEAEGEGYKGMLAVAHALRNRGSLKGVYGLHANRVVNHKYSFLTYKKAKLAWESSKSLPDITHGAQYWEGTKFKTPYWAHGMVLTITIGNQQFYRKD